MRRFMLTAAGVVATAALGVLVASPAHAAPDACGQPDHVVVTHPTDPSYVCVWNHHWMTICDANVDGHRVRAWYIGQWADNEPSWTAWAPSGGCVSHGTGNAQTIFKIRVCVEEEGCGAWKEWP